MAVGTYWFLAGNPQQAVDWYERSLALELRPETLVNLAGALRLLGSEEAVARADQAEERALRLDPFWRRRQQRLDRRRG